MKKSLHSFLTLFFLLGAASAAQAQAVLVNGIATLFRVGVMAAHGDYADKTVTAGNYRGQAFPMKRTPADKIKGEAADNIQFLEAQLEQCHTRLADTTALICPANQAALLKSTQAIIANAQPGWSQKYYKQELAFYLAEDARRQQVLGSPAAVPAAPTDGSK